MANAESDSPNWLHQVSPPAVLNTISNGALWFRYLGCKSGNHCALKISAQVMKTGLFKFQGNVRETLKISEMIVRKPTVFLANHEKLEPGLKYKQYCHELLKVLARQADSHNIEFSNIGLRGVFVRFNKTCN